MSDKYVIRNCPAFVQSSYKNRDWAIENACELIDDRCCIKQNCVLKQIVELCKEVENIENVETLYDATQSGIFLQANRILKLLDIEECE